MTTKKETAAKGTATPTPEARLTRETPQREMARALGGTNPERAADMPDVPQTTADGTAAHAPSSQGQATAALDALTKARGVADTHLAANGLPAAQVAEADASEIEHTTREMAAAGASAPEIAAYRAQAFAKLGE